MTADWDAVLARAEQLDRCIASFRDDAGDDDTEDELRDLLYENRSRFLSAALRERESAKEAERLREALLHQRTALQIVRDRQHGRVSEADLNQGIALIDAAIAAEKGEQT